MKIPVRPGKAAILIIDNEIALGNSTPTTKKYKDDLQLVFLNSYYKFSLCHAEVLLDYFFMFAQLLINCPNC